MCARGPDLPFLVTVRKGPPVLWFSGLWAGRLDYHACQQLERPAGTALGDGNAARDRHFAAHPEDRGANIVLFDFYDDEKRLMRVRITARRLGRRAKNPKARERF